MEPTKPKVFLNRAEEVAYDREQRRRQPDETHGNLLPLKKDEEGGVTWAWPQWIQDTINAVTLPSDVTKGYEPTSRDTSEFALAVGGVGLGASAALKPDADLGMFIGPRAKLSFTEKENAERALMLADNDFSREDIWNTTGWWKGPDGQWRMEIDDSQMGLKDEGRIWDLVQNSSRQGLPVRDRTSEVVEHKELFDRYKNTKSTFDEKSSVQLEQTPDSYSGVYRRQGGNETFVSRASTLDKLKDTLAHEFQHGVQSREGYSSGSSQAIINDKIKGIVEILPTEAVMYIDLRRRLDGAIRQQDVLKKELASVGSPDGWGSTEDGLAPDAAELAARLHLVTVARNKFSRELEDYGSLLPNIKDDVDDLYENLSDVFGLYQRNMGEAEARVVTARRELTPEQRQARAPWLDYDVPEEELIDDDYFDLLKEDLTRTLKANGYLDREPEWEEDIYAHLKELK